MTRRDARELALQTLFSVELGKHAPGDALVEAFERTGAEQERVFVKDLVYGTIEHAADADALIGPLLQGWTLDRLPTMDKLIMRLAVFEMKQGETPRAVVLNEAVELAKKFSTEESGKFVNGVLAGASKRL